MWQVQYLVNLHYVLNLQNVQRVVISLHGSKTSDVQCSWLAQYFGDLIDKVHVQYLMNLQHSLAEACFTSCARQIALVAAQH